jgi:two-component SAPR family response regulator
MKRALFTDMDYILLLGSVSGFQYGLIPFLLPNMNGFQLCQKLLELDANIRVCFISALEVNIQALREVYPKVSFGCFIKKPVTMERLIKRLSELD